MKEYKVPIQSLIDHIKTAADIDPWAKEMAEELLKEQEPVKPEVDYICGNTVYVCGKCKSNLIAKVKFCTWCGQAVKWDG